MSRPVDEPIPPDEPLYRGLTPKGFKDDDVLPWAIDLKGSSVNRHKYNPDPRAAMSDSRGDVAVAMVTVRRLPPALETSTGVTYQWVAQDLPRDDNPAHAELRPHRVPQGWSEGHRIAEKNKELVQWELAKTMKVIRPPFSPAGLSAPQNL